MNQNHLMFREAMVGRRGLRTNENKAREQQKNKLMLDGIDLGEIMRQTVMEELRLIRVEKGENLFRMEGS